MLDINKLKELYFKDINEDIYQSADEQRADIMSFVDLLCALCFDEINRTEDTLSGRRGARLDNSDMAELLAPEFGSDGVKAPFYEELSDLFSLIMRKGYDNDSHPVTNLSRLLEFLSDPAETVAVVFAFAGELNRKYESVFKLLSDDASATGNGTLTVGLVYDMCRFILRDSDYDRSSLYDPDSFANICIFREEGELREKNAASRELRLRKHVLSYILGDATPVDALSVCGGVLPFDGASGEIVCHEKVLEELKLAINSSRVIEISGDEGSGRRFLLKYAAAGFGKKILYIDMQLFSMLEEDEASECMSELVFNGAVCDNIPYLCCRGRIDAYSDELRCLLYFLTSRIPTVIIGSEKPLPEDITGSVDSIYRISVPETASKQQAVLWQEAAKKNALSFAEDYSIDILVSKYVMNPGRIFDTMGNVAACGSDSSVISPEILEEQIRRSCSVQFGESATRLSSPFTWSDMMISPESESLLRMAAERVKYRAVVNEDFGFARKLPYGRGVAIVLYGPPGTGKTMAAQVLANELGLDIYRIDLSQVSSKYIGETEKNLGVVFDAAKNSNAILFFDEADSLFSKRTEVSSSNDKYANAETSYLLQKIEEYSGVSVLATNNMQNFDAAFRRRMTFLIPIEAPDEDTRKRLWDAVFPPGAPLDEAVDTRILAKVAQLTGSSIKSAAVTAAYLAASKKKNITWEDLIRAVDLEGIKTGTIGLGNRLSEAVLTGID